MVSDFRNKLSFEKKEIIFIEKTYALKTDHKTGLLMQNILKQNAPDSDEKILKLVLGETQHGELMAELEAAGQEHGSENYTENLTAMIYGIMSVLYNKPYEDFVSAAEQASKEKK